MSYSGTPALSRLAGLLLFALETSSHPARAADPQRPDERGSGRFPAFKEEVANLPGHVVYRPADIAALGNQKLGVLAWGNGGCVDDGASARFHLMEIASHGYLVIATGRIYSGPGAHVSPQRPHPAGGAVSTAGNAGCFPCTPPSSTSWAVKKMWRTGSAWKISDSFRMCPQPSRIFRWATGAHSRNSMAARRRQWQSRPTSAPPADPSAQPGSRRSVRRAACSTRTPAPGSTAPSSAAPPRNPVHLPGQ